MTPDPDDRQRIAALLNVAGLGPAHAIVCLAGTGNRTFAVAGKGYDVVLRLPGRDTAALVDRAAEAHNAATAASLGIAPGLLHLDPRDGAMVMARVAGRPIPPAAVTGRADALERLGRCLARLHGGGTFAGRMDPWQKIARYLAVAGLSGGDRSAFAGLWTAIEALRGRTQLQESRLVPCHVDPIPANAIDDGARVMLVDWEYAAMSDPHWDLAYVCVEGALEPAEEAALLRGYGDRAPSAGGLADWKCLAGVVSAAWCMARAAADDAALWRDEIANRLAVLAPRLDDTAAAQGGQGAGR